MPDVADTIAGIARAQREDDAAALDAQLADLPSPLPPEHGAPLLATLVDDQEFPEVAWGVVHAAETLPDPEYAGALLVALPGLARTAPDWARTLLVRVLNSPPTLAALVGAIADGVDPEAARVVTDLAARLAADRPERFTAGAEAIAQVTPR